MMVLISYDVSTTSEGGKTRLRKIAKCCLDYGQRVQNSVFEGDVTKGDLQEIRGYVEDTLNEGESVIIYELSSENLVDRTVYGEDPAEDKRFL